jgi:hypothetical protein
MNVVRLAAACALLWAAILAALAEDEAYGQG